VTPCELRYSSTVDQYKALQELEGKLLCTKPDGSMDKSCQNACCPKGTCDINECTSSSDPASFFDGVQGPSAMKSRCMCVSANELAGVCCLLLLLAHQLVLVLVLVSALLLKQH
jgi:hypothetical protein